MGSKGQVILISNKKKGLMVIMVRNNFLVVFVE